MSIELKREIENAIKDFKNDDLFDASLNLFSKLGYNTTRRNRDEKNSFKSFKDIYIDGTEAIFNEEKAITKQWKKIELLFQLTKAEVTNEHSLFDDNKVDNTIIEAYLFFAVELSGESYSKTILSSITREINKLFPMPVMILFKYNNKITLSVIDRRLHKKDDSKDVLKKVTLIKDIDITVPHRAHKEILFDLSFSELLRKHNFNNFVELHQAWQKTLDTKELNKKFFNELANWYFWATTEVTFPADEIKDKDTRNATNVIRLLTRLIFVWFLREKNLLNDEIFSEQNLNNILKYNDFNKSTFYKAILQNLFFATLNSEMGKRKFRTTSDSSRAGNYLIHNVFRYKKYFNKPDESLEKYFSKIPFLNGGLFECLDKQEEIEGKLKTIRIDGFSDRDDNVIKVPDELFFGHEKEVDLTKFFDPKAIRKKQYKVRGLIHILNNYKFTIAENTPIEEEVALDPELLGRVFENLLANYNPETKTTARKQTGSFYTPREIVNYMVDESLIAHFKQKLGDSPEDEARIRDLVSFTDSIPQFTKKEINTLLSAIDDIKILDPACGSGAFPMGILHKLVHIIHKLDPKNEQWELKQLQRIDETIKKAEEITDTKTRESVIKDLETNKILVKEAFANNELDYGRKLFLIENSIYGVDIQPIAVQISKLRFFISLIVDQKINSTKENLGVRPLPNLETKFVAANTLLSVKKENNNLFANPKIEIKKEELKKIRHKYFEARSPQHKRKYRSNDELLRNELSKLLEDENLLQPKAAKKLASWNPYDQNAYSEFFDPEWMFGIDDLFDIVIANPPYLKERDNAKIFAPVNNSEFGKLWHQGKMDFWFYFLHKAIDLAKSEICFITSRYWLNSKGAKKLIKRVNKELSFVNVVDIGKLKVFDAVAGHHMVSHFSKHNQEVFNYIKVSNNIAAIAQQPNSLDIRISRLKNSMVFKDDEIVFSRDIFSNLGQTKKLVELYDSSIGVQESVDKISKKQLRSSSKNGFVVGQGVFVLTQSEIQKLKLNIKEQEIIKPYVDPNDIDRYSINKTNKKFLIYSDKIVKEKIKKNKELSNIKNHLDLLTEFITSSNKPYGIHRPRSIKYFEKPKIIFKNMFSAPSFTYDENGFYFGFSFSSIIQKNNIYSLKYLLSILNSSFAKKWFFTFGKQRGGGVDIGVEKLRQFPIKEASIKVQEHFEIFVDYMLFLNLLSKEEIIPFFERIINGMVFELYFSDHLKELEIDILKYVEKDIKSVMQGRKFVKLNDKEKLKVIDQLHKKWVHPDSIVRNRIILMPIKSPDIIKPILESK